jgi:hypothetical protein
MTTSEIIQSRKFKIAAIAVGAFLVIIVSFAMGVFVGFHKARYSFEWGKNYERNFVGGGMMGGERGGRGQGGGMMGFEGRNFRNAHGLSGTIISITDNNIIVKDQDGKENTVTVTDQTLIKSQQANLKITDLKNNDQIVVMGKPDNNGVVSADLIRVFSNNNQTN